MKRINSWQESGYSLIEILAAIGLVSILGLGMDVLIRKTFQMDKKVRDIAIREIETHTNTKTLIRDLESSFLMRSGFLLCDNAQSAIFKNDNSATKTLEQIEEKISFFYSDFASLATVPKTAENDSHAILSETHRLFPGEVLLIVDPKVATRGGIFEIKEVDKTTSLVKLDRTGMNDIPFECGMSNFTNLPLVQIFDASTGNAMAYRIKAVQYEVVKNANNADLKSLRRKVWPGFYEETVFEFFHLMRITSTWKSFEPDDNNKKLKKGNQLFDVDIQIYRENTIDQELHAQSFSLAAEYVLNSSSRSNVADVTSAPTVEVPYPTCAVIASEEPGMFNLYSLKNSDYPSFPNMKIFRVSGIVSNAENISANMIVSIMGADETGSAQCYPVSSIKCTDRTKPCGQDFDRRYDEVGDIYGGGYVSYFQIAFLGSAQDNYACAVKGNVIFNGELTYFSLADGRSVSLRCSEARASVPTAFKYASSENKSKCYKNGEVYLGQIVENIDVQPRSGPSLYLGRNSCVWGTNPTPTDCNQRIVDLQKVYIKAENTNLIGDPLVIDCTQN